MRSVSEVRRLRICHLISGDLWAGAEVQAYLLLCSLREQPDIQLHVILLNRGKLASELERAGIDVEVIEESTHSFRDILKIAAKSLARFDVEILHSHRYKENILAAKLRERCGIPYLVQTVHGSPEHTSGIRGLKVRLYTFLNYFYSRRFNRIIAVSHDLRQQLGTRFGSEKTVTIHNAVNTSAIVPTRSRAEVKEALGIPENVPVIGVIGRLVAVKGIERFLATAEKIIEKRPQTAFLIVGDGPLFDEYKQRVQSLGLDQQVKLTGFRGDVIDVLNSLDIFVMTSYHEGIPMTLLEAFALKRPVVAMNVGGIPEVVENNVSGILVAPGDVSGMSEACLEILANPIRARELGDNARRRLESDFAIEVHGERVMSLYRSLGSGHVSDIGN